MKAYSTLLDYKSSRKASSSAFRNDVRSFMIDLTSQLLTLNDLENELIKLENESRDLVTFGNTRIAMIENKATANTRSGRVIYETFSEESFTGIHNNTIVKDGFLRLNSAARQPSFTVSDIKVKTIPAKSVRNSVNAISNGDPYSIFGTGVGSDSYWTIVSSKHEPIIEYNGEVGHYETLRGITTEIEFKTSKTIKPAQISAKFSVASRLYRVYGKMNEDSNWEGLETADGLLVEDPDEGLFSLIDTIKSTSNGYSIFKIVINTPTYSQEQNGRKYYRFGIYNLKLLEQKDQANGVFVSNNYTSQHQTFKCKVDAADVKPGGSVKYNVNFNLGNYTHKVPVYPYPTGGATTTINNLILKPAYASELNNFYILPFPAVGGSIEVSSEAEGNFEVAELTMGYEINNEIIPGTQYSMFSTLRGVTSELLNVTYTTKSLTPYLYYIERHTEGDLSELVLKSPDLFKEYVFGEEVPKILRCDEVLYNHVTASAGDVILLKYDRDEEV